VTIGIGIAVLLSLVLLNLWAIHWVIRDHLSSRAQRVAQLIIVWAVPVLGAMLTLMVKRQRSPRPSGRYREEPEPGDDFGGFGRSYRQTRERHENDGGSPPGDL